MRISGLDINGGVLQGAAIENVTNFPTNPKAGSFVLKDKRLWVCGEIAAGVPMWLPCSQELEMVTYVQNVNADTWVIPHNFGTNKFATQVYDENSNWVFPDQIKVDVNNVTVKFLQPTTGFVVMIAGSQFGTPQPPSSYTANFDNSDTWVVNHMLGYDPIVQCVVGNAVAEPDNIEYDPGHNQLTITFSSAVSGQVRCI